MTTPDAAARWSQELAAWALPPEILAAAPEDPYAFPADLISIPSVDPRRTPTGEVVTEVLADGDRLLDVGVGAGRIAASFVDRFDVVGVEPQEHLADVAAGRGITVHRGRWPGVAEAVGTAPVVLSTHVAYDVADIGPFLTALHAAATRRVVLEVTDRHPWAELRPLYLQFVHLDRPTGPTETMLRQVVTQVLNVTPRVRRWQRPGATYASVDALLAHRRRQLCLAPSPSRDAALTTALLADATALGDGRVRMPSSHLSTIWWDVG